MSPRPAWFIAFLLLGASLAHLGCASPHAPAREAAVAWRRPLRGLKLERTAARLERGRYLASALLQCAMCHSERDWKRPGAPPAAGREFAGAILRADSTSRLVAPNLTSDPSTGAGTWTDDMFIRAIREGVGHDGRALHPQMWYGSFRDLADEDVASVVVYLRSLAPVRHPLPATLLPQKRRREIEASLQPLTAAVPMPDTASDVGRGRYLVRVADCSGCHTAWGAARNPGIFAGGNPIARHDGGVVFSRNITPHPTGIGAWDTPTFIGVIRSGKSGTMDPVMPWVVFRGLSDRDLAAIDAVLRTMAPCPHLVDNTTPPTFCVLCRQTHGLGDQNAIEHVHGIALTAAELDSCAGTYRSEQYGFSRTVTRKGRQLFGSEQGGPPIELVPVSARHFLAPGWLAPVDFIRDASGHVTAMISCELDSLPLARVR
jgi:mono/diheme cytochrome c family protein